MKKIIVLLLISTFTTATFAQSDDLTVDESLIVNILKVTNKGYISIRDIKKATELGINESDATIVRYQFVWKENGKEIEMSIDGAAFSEEMKLRIAEFRIGTKFEIRNIVVDNASGRVLAKNALFTVKS